MQTGNIKRRLPTTQQAREDLIVNGTASAILPGNIKNLNRLDDTAKTAHQGSIRLQSMAASSADAISFGKVRKRKTVPTDKFLESIFSLKSIRTATLEYGNRIESRAKTEFLKDYLQKQLHKCGFVVTGEFEFLGTDPDWTICDNGERGIIEIKCPYQARHSTTKSILWRRGIPVCITVQLLYYYAVHIGPRMLLFVCISD